DVGSTPYTNTPTDDEQLGRGSCGQIDPPTRRRGMCSSYRKQVRGLGFILAVMCVWVASAALATPAQAQTICNSTVVATFPNGDNLSRVIGNNVVMSIAIHNGPSLNAGVDDDQTFAVADFFPSCLSVGGGICTPDQGENAGAPPPIAYAGSMSTDCSVVPTVD